MGVITIHAKYLLRPLFMEFSSIRGMRLGNKEITQKDGLPNPIKPTSIRNGVVVTFLNN